MKLVLYMNLLIFVCAFFGMDYGIRKFLIPNKALFLKIITCAMGCLMFARLYYVVTIFTHGTLIKGFHIGMLGVMGSFMFLLLANYGQMDGLVDDKSKTFLSTRLVSLLAPIFAILVCILFCMNTENIHERGAIILLTVFMLPASYYNFKHIIIYDVELGIVSSIRSFNILALTYEFLTLAEFICYYKGWTVIYVIACVGISILAASILPVLKGGVEKWTI